jgi:DNA-binding FadR family transcriptional regulator
LDKSKQKVYMPAKRLESSFLRYLIQHQIEPGASLPTLQVISDELGISVGKLREQLEVARHLGLVSVRPRLGMQREPFDFSLCMREAMLFALGSNEASFEQLNQMRQALEISLWKEAVTRLTAADLERLDQIISQAWGMLYGEPVHVPKQEHRDLHLTIFSRLDNPFVQGVLKSYWEAYELNERTRYTGYEYWIGVWEYHERIVKALKAEQIEESRQLLIEHFSLLRPTPKLAQQVNGSTKT